MELTESIKLIFTFTSLILFMAYIRSICNIIIEDSGFEKLSRYFKFIETAGKKMIHKIDNANIICESRKSQLWLIMK